MKMPEVQDRNNIPFLVSLRPKSYTSDCSLNFINDKVNFEPGLQKKESQVTPHAVSDIAEVHKSDLNANLMCAVRTNRRI